MIYNKTGVHRHDVGVFTGKKSLNYGGSEGREKATGGSGIFSCRMGKI